MRIYMQTDLDDDKPLRYYQLVLQEDMLGGWTLIREWGRQNAAARIKRDHFESLDQAEQALIKVRDAQIKRGFKVVFMRGIEPT